VRRLEGAGTRGGRALRYEVEVGGRVRQVVLTRSGGLVTVEIDGRAWQVDAVRVDAHTWSLLVDGTQVRDVTVSTDPGTHQLFARVGAALIPVVVNGHRRSGRPGESSTVTAGPQRMVAPMPGKIARVLVKPGDAVTARQPVVVVEAMKMENELRAIRGGTVSEIHVREGASVDAGALLVVIL
jgi:biotin carboxyl carrier protein